MLSNAEKSDIRRHLGYPAMALPLGIDSSATLGVYWSFRLNQNGQLLETRMQTLEPVDEARITGLATGAVALIGLEPEVDDEVTITIDSADLVDPVVITHTVTEGQTKVTIGTILAQSINQSADLAAARIVAKAPYGSELPEISITATNPFTLTVSSTGNIGAAILQQGVHVEPTATVEKKGNQETIKYGYLPILNYLEGAIAGSTQNLDTLKADVWVANPREVRDRRRLYSYWADRLAQLLGVPVQDQSGLGRTVI